MASQGMDKKEVKVGDTVSYTSRDGQTNDATVDTVDGEHLNLTVQTPNGPRQYTAVPMNADGGAHSWTHKA